MNERQQLYQLVDLLPESKLSSAFSYLSYLSQDDDWDPELLDFLQQRAEECRQAEARGEVYTHEQVKEMAASWISKSSG